MWAGGSRWRRKRRNTIKQDKEWMQEHLPYEINMLNSTHRLLDWSDVTLLLNGVLINALIESYCVHARALIELFEDEDEAARKGGQIGVEGVDRQFSKDWDVC